MPVFQFIVEWLSVDGVANERQFDEFWQASDFAGKLAGDSTIWRLDLTNGRRVQV